MNTIYLLKKRKLNRRYSLGMPAENMLRYIRFLNCSSVAQVFFFFFQGVGVSAAPHSYRILDLGPGIELGSQKWKCRVLTIGQPRNSLLLSFKKKKTDIWTCYKGNFLRDNGQIKRWEELYLSLRPAITTLPEY